MFAQALDTQFARDVRAGLTQPEQKTLPCRYLYDEIGSALFDADNSATVPFAVSEMASKITYTGGLKGAPNKSTAVSAKVVDALGRPLAGYPVTFVIGSQSVTATTNSSGVAATQIVLTQKPGFYPLTASWAGDSGKYQGDSTSAQFSLNKK